MKPGALQAPVSLYGGVNEMKFLYTLGDHQNISYSAKFKVSH